MRFFLALLLAGGSPSPLTLSISPAHQFAPGVVVFTIHVTPNVDNRILCMGYLSDRGNERISCQDLEGADNPTPTFLQRFPDLDTGTYQGFAQLFRHSVSPAVTVTRDFFVLSQY